MPQRLSVRVPPVGLDQDSHVCQLKLSEAVIKWSGQR